jgi:YjbE family integral membrane protein
MYEREWEPFVGEFIQPIISIIIIDLVLSGDNAVVIGMAAGRLTAENRRRAIIIGGVGAVGLRIIFTAMAAILLDIPYLEAVGGLVLLWIAYKLTKPDNHEANVSEANSLGEAIRTIILADVVMSLDNILAVGGAAHGNLWLLLFGLTLSIPIILFGSNLVANSLARYPLLVFVGALVLVHTAVDMVLNDHVVVGWWDATVLQSWGIIIAISLLLVAIGFRDRRKQTQVVVPGHASRELH